MDKPCQKSSRFDGAIEMKMPEGWEQLENRTKSDLPTYALLDALYMMKEMAEALEERLCECEFEGEKWDNMICGRCRVLKKFEEWK